MQGHKPLQYPQFLRKWWVRGASFFAARNALFQKISRQAGIRALDREDESWLEQEVYSVPPKETGTACHSDGVGDRSVSGKSQRKEAQQALRR